MRKPLHVPVAENTENQGRESTLHKNDSVYVRGENEKRTVFEKIPPPENSAFDSTSRQSDRRRAPNENFAIVRERKPVLKIFKRAPIPKRHGNVKRRQRERVLAANFDEVDFLQRERCAEREEENR